MMNLATPQGMAIREYQAAPISRAHVFIGVAVSLLVHLLLFAWTWQHRAERAQPESEKSITVHLRPAPLPPREVEPRPPAPLPVKEDSRSAKATKSARPLPEPATPQVVQTTTAKDQQPLAPSAPAQTEKHLDMNAIYGGVKTAVAQVDREKAETPNGQLAAKPLYGPEDGNKMGKMIDGTTRADCKEQVEGYGLLTLVAAAATLLDKKDSGCKWR